MAEVNDTEGPRRSRESEAQQRAIRLGLSLLRIVGEDRLSYLLQSESAMTLDQVEDFLDMLEGRRDALAGIAAIAGLLTGDEDTDRTAALLAIEREAKRLMGVCNGD